MAFATGIATLAVVPAIVLLQANLSSTSEAPALIQSLPAGPQSRVRSGVPSYTVIVVSNEEQARRIRESFAADDTLSFVGTRSMSFETVVLDTDHSVETLRLQIEETNGLLAGTGREISFVDARY